MISRKKSQSAVAAKLSELQISYERGAVENALRVLDAAAAFMLLLDLTIIWRDVGLCSSCPHLKKMNKTIKADPKGSWVDY
jgi:hypothetical protein